MCREEILYHLQGLAEDCLLFFLIGLPVLIAKSTEKRRNNPSEDGRAGRRRREESRRCVSCATPDETQKEEEYQMVKCIICFFAGIAFGIFFIALAQAAKRRDIV